MRSDEISEASGGVPLHDPPPDDPYPFASASHGEVFEPRPDGPVDVRPVFAALPPFQRRRELFAHFLDAAEQSDVRLAVTMAERARRIDALREVSVSIAAEESAEETARSGARSVPESGWSVENRARTELVTELAMAFTLSKNAARTLLAESQTLVADLPLTLGALGDGAIRYEHARVIAQTAWSMPVGDREALEVELVPLAGTLILSAFRARAQAARERLTTESMQDRHERAAASRTVAVELGQDGMGYLSLYDSNEAIAAIYNRVTDLALPKTADDPRTLAQRRADVTTAILIDGDLCPATTDTGAEADDGTRERKPLGHGIVAQVHIEVPVLTLLGADDRPATLEGKVPIDPATARRLVADAPGFFRLLTDPVTGSIVAFDDRFRYLPASLRRAVRLIDGECTSPWCDATPHESDGHHPDPWQQSHDTSLENSARLHTRPPSPPQHEVDHAPPPERRQTMDQPLRQNPPRRPLPTTLTRLRRRQHHRAAHTDTRRSSTGRRPLAHTSTRRRGDAVLDLALE